MFVPYWHVYFPTVSFSSHDPIIQQPSMISINGCNPSPMCLGRSMQSLDRRDVRQCMSS